MADDSMPSSYETKTTTTTSSGPAISFHPEYLKTVPGILKIVEVVLAFVTFICATIWGWGGAGWVQFVSISAFLTTLVLLILILMNVIYRIPGPLNLIVLSFIVFICGCAGWWPGSGWVQFVSITAFITTIIDLILHALNLISRIPGPWLLIEFIYYVVFTVFFLIAAIVAAAAAGKYYGAEAAGAAAFFAFAATAVYGVDTFFQFRAWRSGSTETSATTTTTTTVESGRTTTY